MILREYQDRALGQLFDWFEKHEEGNPIVSACVGAGKSVMLAWLSQHALKTWEGTRIIMLVPQKELLEQNLEKLVAVWPDAPVGVHSASMSRKDLGHDILICTIGSVKNKAHLLGGVDLVFVDECHLIPTNDSGMYRQFLEELRVYNPMLRVVGWTGTPFRGNGEWLTAGESPLFTHIVSRVTMDELLSLGYLSTLVVRETQTKLSAAGVAVAGGDYVLSQLAAAIDRPELVAAACEELIRLAANRNKWLVYCATVAHAEHVMAELVMRGVPATIVTGETSAADREDRISAFKAGRYRAIVNVAVLTTGFDVPEVDCIALLRNTKSPVLYVQIAGRGMRVADGKTDCLWLDFTDTTSELGPVNKVSGRKRRRNGPREAPMKICDECGSLNPINAKECTTCLAPFPVEDEPVRHGAAASTAPAIETAADSIKTYAVTSVTYRSHNKAGKPTSMCVSYWSGMIVVAREWVCFNHEGFARSKAVAWWRWRTGFGVPESTEQALLNTKHLVMPTQIQVNVSGKYPEIVRYFWEEEAEAA